MSSLAASLGLGAVAGCGKAKGPPLHSGIQRTPPAASSARPFKGPYPTQTATLLSKLAPGMSGPYLTSRGDRGMAVYGGPGQKGDLSWAAVPLGPDGVPTGPAKGIASVKPGVTLATLKPLGTDGFVLLLGGAPSGGSTLEAVAIADDGSPRSDVVVIHRHTEPIVWLDVVTVGTGAHVFFASTVGKEGSIRSIALDSKLAPKGPAVVVASPAIAWQAAATAGGSLLAFVEPRDSAKSLGRVLAVPLDGDAKPRGAPLVVSESPTAEADLDAASVGDVIAIAWSDRSKQEGKVVIAGVDANGKVVVAPESPLLSAGDQAFVGLTEGDGRLLVAWDDMASRGTAGRRIQLTTFGRDLRAPIGRASVSLGVRDDTVPLLARAPDGFAALTLGAACLTSAPSCQGARVLPTFVRMSADLAVRASGPVLLDVTQGEPPDLAWGLTCGTQGCYSVAVNERESPASYVVSLDGAGDMWRPVVTRGPDGTPPLATAAAAIARGARLSSISVAPTEGGFLVAQLTDFNEGGPLPPLPPDVDAKAEAEKERLFAKDPKRGSRRGAIVNILPVDANGNPKAQASTISVRALAIGGLAIAADRSGKEACLAWVARDDGDPQVFLTRIGADGKKQTQNMITTVKGDVGDVAIAAVPDGYLVAWVDMRDGNGEVYAARVDKNLKKRGPEQRITNATGDASEVALFVRGDDAILAFSDARGGTKGAADAFFARIKIADATKIGDEIRLAATPEHARAIHVGSVGGDLAIMWMDQATGPNGRATLQVATLDAKAALRAQPEVIALPMDSPTSLGLECAATGCRVVVGHADGEGLALSAFNWQRGVAAAPRPLLPLFARAGSDVAPVVIGGLVFVGDEGPGGDGRLRRIGVKW